MSAPFIWIIIPAVISLVMLFFRKKYNLICLIQSGICVVLAGLPFIVQFGPSVRTGWLSVIISPELELLGRSLTLNAKYSFLLTILYGFLAIWSLVLHFTEEKTLLVPLGLLFNGLMLSALSVDPFLYAALIIETAVIISIPIMIESTESSKKSVARFLIYITLGMPFVLLAGWFLAGGEISPINEDQLLQATLLLGLGFIFWLAVFPFHSWMPLVAEEVNPIKGYYVLIIFPIIVFVLLLKFLDSFVWLRDYFLIYDAVRVFGLIMVMSGSIWAVFQTNLRKMIGYLMIFSLGTFLLSISVNTNEGFLNGAYLILPRITVFLLASISIATLEKQESSLNTYQLKSSFSEHPITSLGLVFSLLSLTGMPLTIGFAPMLMLCRLLFPVSPPTTVLLLISMGTLTIFFLRMAYQIFLPPELEPDDAETKTEKFLIAGLLVLLILIGLLPGTAFRMFSNMVSGFEFLIR